MGRFPSSTAISACAATVRHTSDNHPGCPPGSGSGARAGYGLLGALISAWPAVAFIGTVEIATQQVRRARAPRAATIGPAVPEAPGDVEQAVRAAYAASVAAGQSLSQRAMAERFGLSRRKVSQLVTEVTAASNGRLFAARAIAEELVLPQRVLPDPELAADNQDYVPPGPGNGPMAVERDHPSWAEVNAEQQERIHGPATD